MKIPREQLYEEVWAEPMLKIAERYGVSSSFMARVCRNLNVPCPPRGYWAKKQAGQKLKRPALPKPQPGDELEWSREHWNRSGIKREPYPPPSTHALSDRITSKKSTAPGTLHPLLVGAQEKLAEGRETYSTFIRPSKRQMPDIFVTKKTIAHAIQTTNLLFQFLESKGICVDFPPKGISFHPPELNNIKKQDGWKKGWDSWSPDRSTLAFIGTMPIGLSIFEFSEEVEAQQRNGKWVRVSDIPPPSGRRRWRQENYYTSTHVFTTGRIAVRAYSPYDGVPWERYWIEPEAGKLPEMFEEIARSLKIHATKLVPLVHDLLEKRRIEREKQEAAHQAWLKQREIEKEQARLAAIQQARKQAIDDSKAELLGLMAQWERVKEVQDFLAEMEALVQKAPTAEQDRLRLRIERARTFLGTIDLLGLLQRWRTPNERWTMPNEDPPEPGR